MDRHEYSYWLRVEPTNEHFLPDEMVQMKTAMEQSGACWPEGPLVLTIDTMRKFDKDVPVLTGEVKPSQGTVPEDDGLSSHIANIAAKFIDWQFELYELDEEDKSQQTYTCWIHGRQARQSHSRLIPPDKTFDDETVKIIVNDLSVSGYKNAAEYLQRTFLDHQNES